ncbi:hypothetical protein V6N13_109784 [Hibiscus sabdariffa]
MSPTLTLNNNSFHSDDSGSNSSSPNSRNLDIYPFLQLLLHPFQNVLVLGVHHPTSNNKIPKLYTSASLVASPVKTTSGAT